mmetsp:Transcript_25410/g.43913  ORF Transcript_25410/g.43913 Transcript_25410/m.43913 type:complete len:184 (-) Transcript_25410:570-1121(-)
MQQPAMGAGGMDPMMSYNPMLAPSTGAQPQQPAGEAGLNPFGGLSPPLGSQPGQSDGLMAQPLGTPAMSYGQPMQPMMSYGQAGVQPMGMQSANPFMSQQMGAQPMQPMGMQSLQFPSMALQPGQSMQPGYPQQSGYLDPSQQQVPQQQQQPGPAGIKDGANPWSGLEDFFVSTGLHKSPRQP